MEASLISISIKRDITSSTQGREITHKKKTSQFYVVRSANSDLLHKTRMQEINIRDITKLTREKTHLS